MKSLIDNDREIDILFGKLASIVVIAFGFFIVWKSFVDKKLFVLSVFLIILFILIPCLYLFFLKTYNHKLAKLIFQIWFYSILLLCLSVTDKLLADFSGFWRVIFPAAFVTVCMLVGLKGVVRIKDPDQLKKDQRIKIPESHYNLRLLIDSIDIIIAFISVFTLMVFMGKYFHDFVLINWPSLEGHRVIIFYVGIAIGYYPSKILGAAISCIFTLLVNLIYKYCVKLAR